MNPIKSCAFATALVAILVPLEGSGAICSAYTRITNAALNGVFNGVVEGYEDDGSAVIVRFASVTSGNQYTCKEVFSYQGSDPAEQQRLNDEIRRAAILSMSLGYVFSGRIATQNGESRLEGAAVSK